MCRDDGWEGEVSAEPKQQRVVNSEWRMTNGFDHPPEVGGYYLGCALRVESCELRFFFERTTHNSQLFQLACFSRLRFIVTNFSRWTKRE